MITIIKAGVFKPKTYITGCQSSQKEPSTVSVVLVDLKWHKATTKEFQALIDHHTWELVNPSHPIKIVGDKWVLRIKYNLDGSISRYKARPVAKVFMIHKD